MQAKMESYILSEGLKVFIDFKGSKIFGLVPALVWTTSANVADCDVINSALIDVSTH